jgi:hypothetical protein
MDRTMGFAYGGVHYVLKSEGALVALVTWLQLQDADERRAA